jgi:hypothetical protein
MKKSIFNITALKKAANKKPLLFNKNDNNVVIWNASGTFVLKLPEMLFTSEIQNNLPTEERPAPDCIAKTFLIFENQPNPMIDTFLSIELNNCKNARMYQNYKYKYITLIDNDLLKIIYNGSNYTVDSIKENSCLLFKNIDISILLFPLHNKGISEKITRLAEELTK